MMRINAMLERRKDDSGFTLIELMVVVLIIGILIAIAIPTFLGARKRAQDRAAQSSLRNTVTAAKTIYTDHEDYTQATTTALSSAEPSLTFVAKGTGVTTGQAPNTVSVDPFATSQFYAAAMSASGTCWYIGDDLRTGLATSGTKWGTNTAPTTCAAVNAETTAPSGADPSTANTVTG